MKYQSPFLALFAVAATFGCCSLLASDLCVNPGGKSGCSTTIGAAVAAASPGDIIRVAKGTYHEPVAPITITKSLSLLGESSENTIIDATGLLNGISVDGGHDAAHLDGVSRVIISGFRCKMRMPKALW